MFRNYCLLLITLTAFISCKKSPENVDEEIPGSTKLNYKALNTTVDSLQYHHPLLLDLNNDGQTDFYLSSVLLENDDKPYLYLYMNRKTPQLNQILVKQGEELPLNALWAVPLDKGTPIGHSPTGNNVWSEMQIKTALLNVTENGNGKIFDGQWINKKDKYLGLKFEIDGKHHYGWLRISHTLNEAKLAIQDYAYNRTPEQAIAAGAK